MNCFLAVFLSRKQSKICGGLLGIFLPLGPGAPGRFHEAECGPWAPALLFSAVLLDLRHRPWLRDSGNTVASLQTQGFYQELAFQEEEKAEIFHPLPIVSWEPDPCLGPHWGLVRRWQVWARWGPLNPSKIILSANSHFPRKSFHTQIHPIFLKADFG